MLKATYWVTHQKQCKNGIYRD